MSWGKMDVAIDGLGRENTEIVALLHDNFQQCSSRIQEENATPLKLGLFAVRIDETVARALMDMVTHPQTSLCWKQIGFCRSHGPSAHRILLVAIKSCQTLQLTDCLLSEKSLTTSFAALPLTTQLQTLRLVEMRMTESSMIALARGLALNTSLREIDLRMTKFPKASISALATGLRGRVRQSLQVLNLRFCDLDDEALSLLLDGLQQNSSLLELYLRGNYCRNQTMKQLALLLQSPSRLSTLDISRQRPQPPQDRLDLSNLANSLRTNKTLKLLDLLDNRLTDLDLQLRSSTSCVIVFT